MSEQNGPEAQVCRMRNGSLRNLREAVFVQVSDHDNARNEERSNECERYCC